MTDPSFTRQYDQHSYSEEDPVIDSQGHELVHPEPIDHEDELDTDFVAEADDSGDDDYVECIPGDEDGYDGDRFEYFKEDDDDDHNSDDYSPAQENMEIHNQEVTGDATYEGLDDPGRTGEGYDYYYSKYRNIRPGRHDNNGNDSKYSASSPGSNQ